MHFCQPVRHKEHSHGFYVMNGDVSLIGSLLSALICMCMEAASSHHLHSKQLEMALALQLIHNSLQSPASITYKSV